jgi:hypothetical protein
MTARTRPAAYIRVVPGDAPGLARQREAVAEGSRQRGWPPPVIYAEDDTDLAAERAPELCRLGAAIETGRHDALLITEPGAVFGTAPHLTGLLLATTAPSGRPGGAKANRPNHTAALLAQRCHCRVPAASRSGRAPSHVIPRGREGGPERTAG